MREDGRRATLCGVSLYGFDAESRFPTLDHKPQDYCCHECVQLVEAEAERKDVA